MALGKKDKKAKAETVVEDEDLDEQAETSGKKKKEKKEKKEKLSRKEKKAEKAKNGKKKKAPIMPIIISVLIIAFAASLYFDVFGIRTKYVDKFLVNVPVLNKLVTTPEEGDVVVEGTTGTASSVELEKTKAELDAEKQKNKDLETEIARLKTFETEQVNFKVEKEAFDKQVAEANSTDFKAYYESIYPENAAKIYEEIAYSDYDKKLVKDYTAKFQMMEPADAASILNEMMRTDLNLVVKIIEHLDNDTAAQILAEMEPADAATVAKQMAPDF